MRRLAAEASGATGSNFVRLERGPAGRPSVAGPVGAALDVNLSHSGDWIAAAVARGGRVGVDIEVQRPVVAGLAERCLSETELRWLRDGAAGDRSGRLFQLWTLKEAYLKATGEGMAADLRAITLHVGAAGIRIEVAGRPEDTRRWRFRSWRVDGSAWLALCADRGELPARFERVAA